MQHLGRTACKRRQRHARIVQLNNGSDWIGLDWIGFVCQYGCVHFIRSLWLFIALPNWCNFNKKNKTFVFVKLSNEIFFYEREKKTTTLIFGFIIMYKSITECMTKNAFKPTKKSLIWAWLKFFGKLKARNKISLFYLLLIEIAGKKWAAIASRSTSQPSNALHELKTKQTRAIKRERRRRMNGLYTIHQIHYSNGF